MLNILLITLEIVVLLYVTGFGITKFFLPKSLQPDLFLIIPWFATIAIAVLAVYLSLIGFPMKTGAYILLVIFSILSIYQLKRDKIKLRLSREYKVIGILTFIIFLVNIYPLIRSAGFPTTISYGNLDPLAYVGSGSYLIKHTVLGNSFDRPFQPAVGSAADIINYSYRWGAALIFSFFSQITGFQVYQFYTILITIYFSLTYPLVYLLAKKIFTKREYWWLLASVVFFTYGINSTLLYVLYNAFFGQIVFTGVMCLGIILFLSYIKSFSRGTWRLNRYDFILGLMFSSVTTLYPEGFILVYLPIIGYAGLRFFFKKEIYDVIRAVKITILTIIVNPITFFTMSRWFIRMVKVTTAHEKIGWETIRFASPFEAMGFHNLFYSRDLPLLISLLLGMGIVLIISVGLLRMSKKFILISYIGLFGLFYLYFSFFTPNFFVYFRSVTYSLFIYSALFAAGIAIILSTANNRKLTVVLISIIGLLCTRSAYRTLYLFYHHARVVDKALISLQELNDNTQIQKPIITSDVFVTNYDVWTRLWREVFLQNKLIATTSNFNSVKKKLDETTPVLIEKKPKDGYNLNFLMNDVFWENEFYRLGRICKEDKCLLGSPLDLSRIEFTNGAYQDSLLGNGWDTQESDHRWISSSEATLKLITKKQATKLIIEAQTLKEPQEINIYDNDTFVASFHLTVNKKSYVTALPSTALSIHRLRLVLTKGYVPSKIMNSFDTRSLYANIFFVELK